VNRYFVNIEPIEPSGVVLTIEALPRLLIFGETPEEALQHAREAIDFELGDAIRGTGRSIVELVPREPIGFVSAGTR
jgi:predicted RNase H-like HicB family nuclease